MCVITQNSCNKNKHTRVISKSRLDIGCKIANLQSLNWNSLSVCNENMYMQIVWSQLRDLLSVTCLVSCVTCLAFARDLQIHDA